MPDIAAPTILCIATYEKGQEFIRECKRQGCRVLLLTVDSLKGADWPREAIDDTFYIPREIPREDLLKGVSHLARSRVIDRIVALDDFDVETAALLREHLRVPGMGETTARLLPRQTRHAREGAQPGRAGPRVRAYGKRRSGPPVRRGRAGAVDAEATLECGRHRHLPHRAGRRPVASARRTWRSTVVLPARALRERRRLPRGLARVGAGRDLRTRRTSTARRRSASRTRAASSRRAPWPGPHRRGSR